MEPGYFYCFNDVLPFVAMVAVECAVVGINTVFKAASMEGMSYYVFSFYSCLVNTLVLLPFLFFLSRSTLASFLQFPLLPMICLLGILGSLAQIIGFRGVEYSSPTLASAMSNLTPALTFTLAVIFRMERLGLRRRSTQTKIIGTTISIVGALVMLLYKGPKILSSSASNSKLSISSLHHQIPKGSPDQTNWVAGGLLLALDYLLYSILYIVQTKVMHICPSVLSVTLFYNLLETIISAPICFIAEPNLSAWKLSSNVEVAALICSGIFGTSFITCVHSYCLHLKGPVYVTAFKPLSIAIAVIATFLLLEDALYLGSVVGAVMISAGVYAVLRGKAKEENLSGQECGFSTLEPSSSISLLQN